MVFAREAGKVFRAPKKTLGDLDAVHAAELIAATADVALILDGKGVIRDVSLGDEALANEGFESWVGKPWVDTVTIESRPKIEQMLRGVGEKQPSRWRQINHPTKNGADIPLRYMVLRETRYRLLFQIASQPVVIVDANAMKIVEANPAAGELLNKSTKRLAGRAFLDLFDSDSAKAVQAHLAQVRATGRGDEVTAKMQNGKVETTVGASMFRQDASAHFLIRLAPVEAGDAAPKVGSKLLRVVENLPDGFVVTDVDRRIVTANPAFLDLAELTSEEQARGELIDRWIGRPGVDVDTLVTNMREHGSVRNFQTILRGQYGANEDVEISGVSVLTGDYPCYAFTIRNAGSRTGLRPRPQGELPHSVEQLTQLVGRVTLKELVRETTDVIERLCIEAALELTGDNRASAAEMLGLSRQSLYSKLRRFGITEIDSDDDR
ncbi:MAG: transcriptional regulator PpsR [Woeseiaceae bacterium]